MTSSIVAIRIDWGGPKTNERIAEGIEKALVREGYHPSITHLSNDPGRLENHFVYVPSADAEVGKIIRSFLYPWSFFDEIQPRMISLSAGVDVHIIVYGERNELD